MSKKTPTKLHWRKIPKKNQTSTWPKQILMKSSLIIFICVMGFVGQTNAYFSDAVSTQMKMQAGCWANPPVPQLLMPENSASLNPGSITFQWSDLPSSCPGVTVSYLFTLYKDSSEVPLVESPLLSVNQYVANDLTEGTYFWLVAALDSQGHSSISEVNEIKVETVILTSFTAPAPSPSPTPAPSPAAPPLPALNIEVIRSQTPPTVSFTISGKTLAEYIHLRYEITYESEGGLQGIVGESDLSGSSSFTLEPKLLGTCTSGGTCTLHRGVSEIKVKVKLDRPNGTLFALEQTL